MSIFVAYVTQQQAEVYNFFKKFAKKNGRLPDVAEIMEGINVSTPSQALYWAGCILLKGGFGLKVSDGDAAPGIVSFGDFKFPMHDEQQPQQIAPATTQQQPAPVAVPVAAAVARANPVPVNLPSDAPATIRNLINRVQQPKQMNHLEVVQRDILNVMSDLKKYGVNVNLTSRIIRDVLGDSGKRYSPQAVGVAVSGLLASRKIKGTQRAFTYL